ncbi:MAG: hypothetical protein GY861_01800 [bacterium]|nr:hypothetical protein [bacterium]
MNSRSRTRWYAPDNTLNEIAIGFQNLYNHKHRDIDYTTVLNSIHSIFTQTKDDPYNLTPRQYKPKSKARDEMGIRHQDLHSIINATTWQCQWNNFKTLITRLINQDHGYLVLHLNSRMLLKLKTEIPRDWKDYRPISVMPAWLMILSKLIYTRYSDKLAKITSQSQFGAKPQSDCNLAKFHMIYNIHIHSQKHALLLDKCVRQHKPRNTKRHDNRQTEDPIKPIIIALLNIYQTFRSHSTAMTLPTKDTP